MHVNTGLLQLRDYRIKSIEEGNDNGQLLQYTAEVSKEMKGFIADEDDEGDCVCRGGTCPRR